MGCQMSSASSVMYSEDVIVVHSPIIVHGKIVEWTKRTITDSSDWKSKMQKYLEHLFSQLFAYDDESLAHVIEKYMRVIQCSGISHEFGKNVSSRHYNALQEIKKLMSPTGFICQEDLKHLKIYTDVLFLLDIYAQQKRIQDFEEIAFVLTIIINYPNIARVQTRW
jgi:hypothetical protein